MSLLTSLAHASLVSGASGGSGPVLSASKNIAEEGDEVQFILYVPDGIEGTTYGYTITGITQNDLFYGTLTGNFTLDSLQGAQVSIILARDDAVEVETITMTLDESGASVQVTIDDTTIPVGEVQYIIPGTYSWTCPAGVTSVSAVCIGAGGGAPYWVGGNNGGTGGGGGALGYKSNIAVTPGQNYTVVVGGGGSGLLGTATSGGVSYFSSQAVVSAGGGQRGKFQNGTTQIPGAAFDSATWVGDGGANGGATGAMRGDAYRAGGGGGDGGYGGTGGTGGGAYALNSYEAGSQGIYSGGGGGTYGGSAGRGGAGGGTHIFGRTAALAYNAGVGGAYRSSGGSGGDGGAYSLEFWDALTDGEGDPVPSANMRYGGGAGAKNNGAGSNGSSGAVRIMWGPGRSFPDNAEYREWDGNPTVTLHQTLNNPNTWFTSTSDFFGTSASISGNYAIVGAPWEDAYQANEAGVAYIFDVTTGTKLYTLYNPDANGNDVFGTSVSISGNYAIVGAPSAVVEGERFSGKAYIYDVTTGTLLHTLNNPNGYGTNYFDRFGYSVAISGNYAIVGAYSEDDAGGLGSGKAYIFNVTTGALLHTLDNPNAVGTSVDDWFGFSVAISGDYAIVGALLEHGVDTGTDRVGKAYIFNVTTGALLYTLDNPDAAADDYDNFGYSVAISGNYAIVGAYHTDDAGGVSSGKAYIYNVTTGALVHTLDNPNAYGTSAGDQFGWSVAISDNYAIVSGVAEDDAGGVSSGKAYIYNVTTGALVHTLDNPNPAGAPTDDRFGSSLAMSGNYAIVSTQYEDAGGTDSGIAYIYRLDHT